MGTNDESDFGMDWTDRRPLEALRFGDAFPEAERADVDKRVRVILSDLGVKIAEDIKGIGCTTLRASLLPIETSRFLRLGLGGCGVGLTCFVPPDKFCLVHETIGGLQDAQVSIDATTVPLISRDLTAEEREQFGLVAAVREMEGATDRERMDVLAGKRRMPQVDAAETARDKCTTCGAPATCVDAGEGWCRQHCGNPNCAATDTPKTAPKTFASTFRCDEHQQTDWSCRYCLAEAVVSGALVPTLLLTWGDGGTEIKNVDAHELAVMLKTLDENAEDACAVYVKAARWSRRLARE